MANEKRLIDANALKWKIGQVRLYVASLRFGKTIISAILESYQKAVFYEIEDAPTVDAVEVVRCKDCTYWDKAVVNKKGFLICPASGMEIKCDDFCSYGERKDDE